VTRAALPWGLAALALVSVLAGYAAPRGGYAFVRGNTMHFETAP
jgi:hypothetical protein